MPNSSGVDKEGLYGKFQNGEERQTRLYLKAAHKALDIADDNMHINASNRGIGWKELAVVGAAIVAVCALWLWSQRLTPPALAPEPAAVAPVKPVEPAKTQEFQVEFWAEDDTQINVEGTGREP